MIKKISNNLELLILLFIIGAVFGFVYECLFYRIDLGYFVNRGSTYGPWIPIYGYGSVLIYLGCYKFVNRWSVVFLISLVITTVLEYVTGFVLLRFFDTRLWDYNTEIFNYGNIDGFVCLRSVLFFAFSSLLLMYVILPVVNNIINKYGGKKLKSICIIMFLMFALDNLLYLVINNF